MSDAVLDLLNLPGFAFVANISRLVGFESCEVIPGHVIRRASQDEIQIIRQMAPKFNAMHMEGMPLLWERKHLECGPVETLPEEEQRFHLIDFRGCSNQGAHDLQTAFNLCQEELDILFCYVGRGFAWNYSSNCVIQNAFPEYKKWFVELTEAHVDEIKKLHTQLSSADSSIKRHAEQLNSLKGLFHIDFKFLGYFALLESMLTHKPKPSDPYESITRQVKSKLTLLNNRWSPKLDYSPFKSLSHEKIWGLMYEYRSRIAHGAVVNFEDNSLRELQNQKTACSLIRETVKSVIRQYLIEPALLLDLQNC